MHFYETDGALADVVSGFLIDGLTAGEGVVVIAVDSHAAAFRSRLSALGVDVRTGVEQGRLRFIDAHAMLDALLVDGAPDRARFDAQIGAMLEQAGADCVPVRVYGEMVDVLWRQGRQSAALLLEEMWNQLAAVRRFSLLCAYTMGDFCGQPGADGLRIVCGLHHGGVHHAGESAGDAGSSSAAPDPRILALEAEIRERQRLEAALRRSLAAAGEEARAKDEFIAMLSHELRGPLAPIRSALQLMRLRGDGGVTREREIIDRQVGNLIRLVDDLLDASRIATGKIKLRRERVDLAEVLEMAVEMAAPVLHARGHSLHVRARPGAAIVDGDAVRLTQVVSNLLSNAAKYTERNGRISVELQVDGEQVVLSVRDTGIGIEPDLVARVFERGVQGSHGIGGLGLGLTIVRALVELHGGAIAARSEGRGCGSEFQVTLPLAEPSATAGAPLRPQPDPPAGDTPSPIRLLIVDDDEDLADTLAELLAVRGFITRVARDGEEAVRAFAQFRPQAALIDISLRAMNGRELARRLREVGTEAKLIALSGYGRREDEEASLASGFDLHLVKPVRPDVIEAHLRGISRPASC